MKIETKHSLSQPERKDRIRVEGRILLRIFCFYVTLTGASCAFTYYSFLYYHYILKITYYHPVALLINYSIEAFWYAPILTVIGIVCYFTNICRCVFQQFWIAVPLVWFCKLEQYTDYWGIGYLYPPFMHTVWPLLLYPVMATLMLYVYDRFIGRKIIG